MSTKKSLLITIDFPPQIGGAGYYISQVALHLPQKDLVILAPKMENSEIFDREQRYKIYRKNLISKLCFIWPKWLPLLYKSLKIVKKERIKTIQVGQVLPVGIVALFIKKLFRIPYIVYTNAMDVTMPAARHGRKKRILKSVLKEAYKVITISEFTKGELIKLGVKKENIVIVRPCTDILEKIKNQKSKIKNVKEEIVKKYNLKNKRILYKKLLTTVVLMTCSQAFSTTCTDISGHYFIGGVTPSLAPGIESVLEAMKISNSGLADSEIKINNSDTEISLWIKRGRNNNFRVSPDVQLQNTIDFECKGKSVFLFKIISFLNSIPQGLINLL